MTGQLDPAALTRGVVAAAIVARLAVELGLEHLNRRHAASMIGRMPDALKGAVEDSTYDRSIEYALAKGPYAMASCALGACVTAFLLFSGVLPAWFEFYSGAAGSSAWASGLFLFLTGVASTLPDWPLDYLRQFRLEERFGFNRSTRALWWGDRAKGTVLAAAIGVPLLSGVVWLVSVTGNHWWLWGWGLVMAVQVLMMVVAPKIILPWFNRFDPLPEGSLRDRLLALGRRTGFRADHISVMDGSKRSGHANAFFTGFGRWRRIVLFDTLIRQLTEPELEAVLAHEIGHYKRGHIPRMIVLSCLSWLAGFWVLDRLASTPWFYEAFGFGGGSVVPALMVFGLLAGVATFWLAPLFNRLSRRWEYQADAFAASAMGEAESLRMALRKLDAGNLGNPVPHPAYSGFHYSHPTLPEREAALG